MEHFRPNHQHPMGHLPNTVHVMHPYLPTQPSASWLQEDLRLQACRILKPGVKKHVCEICGKVFRAKQNLREHTYIHTQEKPFECKICGERFRQHGRLSLHKKRHHSTSNPTVLQSTAGNNQEKSVEGKSGNSPSSSCFPSACIENKASQKAVEEKKQPTGRSNMTPKESYEKILSESVARDPAHEDETMSRLHKYVEISPFPTFFVFSILPVPSVLKGELRECAMKFNIALDSHILDLNEIQMHPFECFCVTDPGSAVVVHTIILT